MSQADSTGAEDLARRLLTMDWRLDESRLAAHVTLVREYLRRAALWARALEATDLWPFADFAGRLIAEPVPADVLEALRSGLTSRGVSPRVQELCVWAVHWAQVPPARIASYGLPDLFEPLIRLFERGGTVQAEHGFVYVFHAGIPAGVKGWQYYHRP